jgi:hypothetical protein
VHGQDGVGWAQRAHDEDAAHHDQELVHSTSLGCTLPLFLIAVGTVLAAGPGGRPGG